MSDTEETLHEQKVLLEVARAFEVLPGKAGEFDCVLVVLETDQGLRTFAFSSEDAKHFSQKINSIAATVRPVKIQQRHLTVVKENK